MAEGGEVERSVGAGRRARWLQVWGGLVLAVGLFVLVLAGVGLATVPGLLGDEREFRDAVPCGTSAPLSASVTTDCLRRVDALVTGTVVRDEADYEEFTLKLRGSSEVPDEVDMGAAGPLLGRLHRGDRVTLTLWRDYVPAVTKGGVVQDTADTPVGEPQFVTAVALVLLSAGAFPAYAGVHLLRAANRPAGQGLLSCHVSVGRTSFGAGFCVLPAMPVGDWAGPVGMLAVWLGLVPLVWLGVRRYERRGRGRHARGAAPQPVRTGGRRRRWMRLQVRDRVELAAVVAGVLVSLGLTVNAVHVHLRGAESVWWVVCLCLLQVNTVWQVVRGIRRRRRARRGRADDGAQESREVV
ncbi:hypothetical protein [Streptomyces sp. NPDC051561]|uniref:hypothetical protein n=1 Tax=Streptomyces sp. NPDC051561 TaxID=3365658 RepID=UPI0037B5E78A